ncbi:hypothetical protein CHLRE_06g293100v5 [Chlamydomonas reinhardtii]|uniref:t-SNARE coiled-coil homology domain-containing protein n=1 Tax=Chlamydomonas reinhardtii TaxID=3055 RepID=A0A2K3DQE5_CHLRE|nr:uncharacterized protein CHLRE_06g293100v5 [Chlamydomonas reinhardtii]PNW82764.1 hypothetical protein CHLRE_06g293100v5 [Chlamydomonas reinhardtii]
MQFSEPFNIIRADIDEQVRVLAKGSGELTAAVWAESADVARLAGNLGYDCDALLAELGEVERAMDIVAAEPQRFHVSPAEVQARRSWISTTRDAVRRTAENVAPHRPPPVPRQQPVAIGVPVTVAGPLTCTFISPEPYSAASDPCMTHRSSPPLSGSMRVASAIAGAAHANAAYAASATASAAVSTITPVRGAAAAARTAASSSASAAHRAASAAVGAGHTAAAAGTGAVLGGAGGFISGQLQAQQRAIRRQDGLLDDLSASLDRIADQGRRIGRELEEQTGALSQLEAGVDAAVGGLRGAHRRALGLLRGR